MSQTTLYNNLKVAHLNIEEAIMNGKKAAFEYEVFMSDLEHKNGGSTDVENIASYFSNLLKQNEKDSNI